MLRFLDKLDKHHTVKGSDKRKIQTRQNQQTPVGDKKFVKKNAGHSEKEYRKKFDELPGRAFGMYQGKGKNEKQNKQRGKNWGAENQRKGGGNYER
jgi:hypothetical protein